MSLARQIRATGKGIDTGWGMLGCIQSWVLGLGTRIVGRCVGKARAGWSGGNLVWGEVGESAFR